LGDGNAHGATSCVYSLRARTRFERLLPEKDGALSGLV